MKRAEEVRTVIDAAPAEVWRVLADVRAWPDWAPTVRAVEMPDGPLAVGSEAVLDQPGLPAATWRVTALEPERGFTWQSLARGVVTSADHELHPTGAGTELVLRITHSGTLAPVARLLGGRMTRRYLNQEAEGLKVRVEGGAPAG